MWKEATCWISKVEEGYYLKLQQGKTWKREISILVIPSWHGTFWGNLVQWIQFNNILEWNLDHIGR